MPQPALGRGLGDLLNGTKTVSERNGAAQPLDPPEPVRITPGVGTLLRGNRTQPEPADPTTTNPVPAFLWQLVFWSLILADLVACALASMLLLSQPEPPGAGRILSAFTVLGVGTWLSCLAIWLKSRF